MIHESRNSTYKGIGAITAAVVAVAWVLLVPSVAYAEGIIDMLTGGMSIESDIRYIVEKNRGEKEGDGLRFDWNRNTVSASVDIFPGERTHGRISGKFVFYGFGNESTLQDLTEREKLDPYWFELNEAYFEIRGFMFDSLDVKIGRQIVTWGAADVFNPTDLLSPRDLSDPIDYAAKMPNTMIQFNWYPADFMEVTAVVVPFFRPARLPESAILGLLSLEAVPIKNRAYLEQLSSLQSMLSDPSLINIRTHLLLPDKTVENIQAGARVLLHLGDYDTSFSYYFGRFGFPQPLAIDILMPSDDPKYLADVDAYLYYPRTHMFGTDISASLSWLWDLGVFAEAALYLPEKVIFAMRMPEGVAPAGFENPITSTNIEGTPFLKATAGIDYSFGSHFYTNIQYIYGFLDEFGDISGLRHYLAPDLDIKMLDETVLVRLAGVVCFSDWSASLNPVMVLSPADGVELSLGGLIFIGDTKRDDPLDYASFDKFGQKASGRSWVYMKAKLSI